MVGTILAIGVVASLAAQQPIGEGPDTAAATQATRTTRYDAAFFATFAPRSALDIARRVPGFALEQGNNDIRGFAGAAGNVVINGARPSSKSESIETLLARIPARRVIRVELGSGELYGSEYSGKSQVLNVILSADSGLDGSITASARRRYTGLVVPNLSGTALLKRGNSSFGLSAGTQREDTLDEGTDTLTEVATGDLVEFRRKTNHYRPRSPFVAGTYSLENAPDKAIHLNARFERFTEDFVQTNLVFPADGPDRDDRLYLTAEAPAFELGGDISRPLAGGVVNSSRWPIAVTAKRSIPRSNGLMRPSSAGSSRVPIPSATRASAGSTGRAATLPGSASKAGRRSVSTHLIMRSTCSCLGPTACATDSTCRSTMPPCAKFGGRFTSRPGGPCRRRCALTPASTWRRRASRCAATRRPTARSSSSSPA